MGQQQCTSRDITVVVATRPRYRSQRAGVRYPARANDFFSFQNVQTDEAMQPSASSVVVKTDGTAVWLEQGCLLLHFGIRN
jgi:hypothetical protein